MERKRMNGMKHSSAHRVIIENEKCLQVFLIYWLRYLAFNKGTTKNLIPPDPNGHGLVKNHRSIKSFKFTPFRIASYKRTNKSQYTGGPGFWSKSTKKGQQDGEPHGCINLQRTSKSCLVTNICHDIQILAFKDQITSKDCLREFRT